MGLLRIADPHNGGRNCEGQHYVGRSNEGQHYEGKSEGAMQDEHHMQRIWTM